MSSCGACGTQKARLGNERCHTTHACLCGVTDSLSMHQTRWVGVYVQDCFAMGGQPHTALAVAVVPFGPEAHQEEELYQLMAGAQEVLQAEGCVLVGGHSGEGQETAVGQ